MERYVEVLLCVAELDMIVMCYYFLSFIGDLILFVSIIGNIRPEYGEHASWYWDLKGKYL